MNRLEILKTYKLYINGKFPRSESGRYYTPEGADGKALGNICQSSRKDLRESVRAARSALGTWAPRAAFNRSQILYRIGEMLEGRRAQFETELKRQGSSAASASKEVENAIDLAVYYAGWCDKYQQVFSAVNPVSTSHFNFSVYEPVGVVAAIAPEQSALAGLLGTILPIIAGGNTCITLASNSKPLSAITLAEVLATSDLPGGVVNILTGDRKELLPVFATHMDINALVASDLSTTRVAELKQASTHNLKRIVIHQSDLSKQEDPYVILKTQEIKTTWHPIETSIAGGGKY
ncbi:aldehyde dehydrogenase family protein [Kiritimatiellaeota bacterium B1221]|nr:aldehyde dehydrogenase family protein [Kiritimatiellaeota bacterium B1221]